MKRAIAILVIASLGALASCIYSGRCPAGNFPNSRGACTDCPDLWSINHDSGHCEPK